MSVKPFAIEYSKSGRANCTKCHSPIKEKILRIAVMIKSPYHDGTVPKWYHIKCLFATNKAPKNINDIDGFSAIKWDDQEMVRKLMNIEDEPTPEPDPVVTFFVNIEYAPSGRSTCAFCSEKIAKGEMKINFPSIPINTKICHQSCFQSSFTKVTSDEYKQIPAQVLSDCPLCQKQINMGENCILYCKQFKSLKNFHALCCNQFLTINPIDGIGLDGLDKINDGDKETLKTTLSNVVGKMKKTTPSGGGGGGGGGGLKFHPLLKKQSDDLWNVRIWLENLKPYFKHLLQVNNLDFHDKSSSAIIDTLSDAIAFGLPKPCPVCNSTLVFESDNYVCNGHINEWTRCFYKTLLPERTVIQYPPEDIWKELRDFTTKGFQIQPRLITKLLPDELTTKAKISVIISENAALLKDKCPPSDKYLLVDDIDQADICVTTSLDPSDKIQTQIQKYHKPILDISYLAYPDHSLQEFCILYLPEDKQEVEDTSDPTKIQTMETLQLSAGGVIVAESGFTTKTADILFDHDEPFNVTMSYTDVMTGRNTFYIMQIIQPHGKFFYFLIRKYGRIGTSQGGHVKNYHQSKGEAIQQFKSLFYEKTGNKWGEKPYVKKTGLFMPIELDYEVAQKKIQNTTPCTLSSSLQELLGRIFDINMLNDTLNELKIDTAKMPLGKISKTQIMEAYQVLGYLDKVINSDPSLAAEITSDIIKESKIREYTNKFYFLVPQVFRTTNVPLLDNNEIIKDKLQLLDTLRDIEITNSIINNQQQGMSVLDGYLKGLNSDVEVIGNSDERFKKIDDYLKNTYNQQFSKLKLNNLYRITRNSEKGDFKIQLPNHKLLWHGTRTSNVASIVSTGLRIAPPEAPCNGYLFGKGVYFADMVGKSSGYTYPINNKAYLFLCDVALGNLYQLYHTKYISKLPDGYHATYGVGTNIPDYSQMYEIDGVEFPGKLPSIRSPDKQAGLGYNEFIVYDVGQIKIKYLLDVEYVNKKGGHW